MPNDVFKALSDPTRRRILEMLAQRGEMSAGEIAAPFEMSAPSVSHHLAILRSANLVADTRHRQSIVYSLNGPVLGKVEGWLHGLLAASSGGQTQDTERE